MYRATTVIVAVALLGLMVMAAAQSQPRDSGQEIYNFCAQEGIKNIVLMGVHTNYCILAHPFGIRQQKKLGMNVVLARDLTDALYDPREPPFVSHARGTEIVIEHIERYLCPSILSEDLTRVVAGSDGPG
jgi:hypothetical protein